MPKDSQRAARVIKHNQESAGDHRAQRGAKILRNTHVNAEEHIPVPENGHVARGLHRAQRQAVRGPGATVACAILLPPLGGACRRGPRPGRPPEKEAVEMIADRLFERIASQGPVCFGLDTAASYLPPGLADEAGGEAAGILAFNRALIDAAERYWRSDEWGAVRELLPPAAAANSATMNFLTAR